MKAVFYSEFQSAVTLETVADPSPTATGVVIEVGATGLCRRITKNG